jgi:hypothetical protein
MMFDARVEVTKDLDGSTVILACFGLPPEVASSAAFAVGRVRAERFQSVELGVDDVLEMRELTALADELAEAGRAPGILLQVLRPARLTAFRHAIAQYVEQADEAEWLRQEDRDALVHVRPLVWPLEELAGDALRAALTDDAPAPHDL